MLLVITDLFYELENISYECDVPHAVCFLRMAKTELSATKKKSEPAHGRQLLSNINILEILK